MKGSTGVKRTFSEGGAGRHLERVPPGAPPSGRSDPAKIMEETEAVGPELLTDAQLAERWQLSRGTLANQRSQGRGPRYLKIAGRVRYRRADIEAYERQGSVETSPLSFDRLSRESIELLIRSAGT